MTELDPRLTTGEDRRHPPRRFAFLIAALVGFSLVVIAASVLVAVNANQTAADRAQQLARDIQKERARSIRQNCEDQNMRHTRTIDALDKAIAAATPPARKARAVANRIYTVRLINALAPLRDCDAVVRKQASVK
jgi:uncharacterized membrane protein YccC